MSTTETNRQIVQEGLDRRAELRAEANWEIFLHRTFDPLIIPSIMAIFVIFGRMPIGLTIAAWSAAGMFIIANTVAYALRNRSARESLARVCKRTWKGKPSTTSNMNNQ